MPPKSRTILEANSRANHLKIQDITFKLLKEGTLEIGTKPLHREFPSPPDSSDSLILLSSNARKDLEDTYNKLLIDLGIELVN